MEDETKTGIKLSCNAISRYETFISLKILFIDSSINYLQFLAILKEDNNCIKLMKMFVSYSCFILGTRWWLLKFHARILSSFVPSCITDDPKLQSSSLLLSIFIKQLLFFSFRGPRGHTKSEMYHLPTASRQFRVLSAAILSVNKFYISFYFFIHSTFYRFVCLNRKVFFFAPVVNLYNFFRPMETKYSIITCTGESHFACKTLFVFR